MYVEIEARLISKIVFLLINLTCPHMFHLYYLPTRHAQQFVQATIDILLLPHIEIL